LALLGHDAGQETPTLVTGNVHARESDDDEQIDCGQF
jgi:hypothetical protein